MSSKAQDRADFGDFFLEIGHVSAPPCLTHARLYIAGAIENGKVKVTVGPTSVPGRDGEYVPQNFRSNANTLIFPNDNPTDETIVHEATHAVIDGTTVGSNISNISDEVAAYVAETVYSLNKGRPVNQVGPVAGPLFELAQSVKNNAGGSAIALDLPPSCD